MKNAFLILDKPAGSSSNQCLTRIKRILNQKKMGHTGTLDPLATGVLPVALGKATRLIPYLEESQKIYEAEALLGKSTDTYDTDGTEVESSLAWQDFNQGQIQKALMKFQGEITQKPPVYSALKYRGKALYKYARQGEEVPVPTRKVTFHKIELLSFDQDRVKFRVTCSKGTYIRSLIHDLGLALGSYACMSALRRLASGSFKIKEAVTLEELEKDPEKSLLDPGVFLQHLGVYEVSSQEREGMLVGKAPQACILKDWQGLGPFRLQGLQGEVLGVAEVSDEGKWKWLCNLA